MADSIISNSPTSVLPSQLGLEPSEVAGDCLEKMRALTLAPADLKHLRATSDELYFHQYVTTLNDLAEIAIGALEQFREEREME